MLDGGSRLRIRLGSAPEEVVDAYAEEIKNAYYILKGRTCRLSGKDAADRAERNAGTVRNLLIRQLAFILQFVQFGS